MDALTAVSRAAAKAAKALEARDDAIREAVKSHSLRKVAGAAGVSYETVRRIAS